MERNPTTTIRIWVATATAAIVLAATASSAQLSLPGGIGGAASGLSGLGGGALPGLGSASAGNITGLLGYCVKNKIVGQMGAGSGVLAKLKDRPETEQSPDYKAGLAGKLLGDKPTEASSGGTAGMLGGLTTPAHKPLSLDSLPAGLRTKACDAVLSHAKSLF